VVAKVVTRVTVTKVEGDPHERLACAVIHQALWDATSSTAPAKVRDSAWQFLADEGRLAFWCTVAGVPAHALRERVSELREREA
jgi:hypothetical protein